MIKLNKKKYIAMLISSIFVVVIATIAVTYAYLSVNITQDDSNTLSTGCYNVNFEENSNSINMTSYPMSSSTAFNTLSPYTFTLTNTCATGSNYQIILNVLNTTSDNLLSYINFSLDKSTTTRLTSLTPTTLPTGVTSSNVKASYVIDTGSLPNINASKTFDLYLWIDESAGNDIMTETFAAEVIIYNVAEAPKVTLTNLITDPSFESSSVWGGGTIDTTHAKYGSTAIRLTGTSSAPEILATNSTAIPLNNTHIYYARYEVYHEGASGTAGIYWPIAEPNFVEGESIGSANTWNIVSAVNNRASFSSSSAQLRLDYNNNNAATTVWYDGLVLIDLTASFGAGNEPNKAWCDANIPFFTGTTTIEY